MGNPADRKGSAVLPERDVHRRVDVIVERTLARLSGCRRPSKDCEYRPETGQAMIRRAMLNRVTRLLADP